MLKKKNKLILCALLFIFTFSFFWNAFTQRKYMLELYNDGIDKINNKEYQEAQEILSELGDYKDSFDQIDLAKILQQQK